jgi:large subunit ribosomal protein L24
METKLKIKIGDTVRVISGSSKGSEGKILKIDRKKNRVKVEGVNIGKKHVKPSASRPQGGMEDIEGSIHISNVMVVSGGVASRIGKKKNADGKFVRILKKNGEVVK